MKIPPTLEHSLKDCGVHGEDESVGVNGFIVGRAAHRKSDISEFLGLQNVCQFLRRTRTQLSPVGRTRGFGGSNLKVP